MRPEERARPTPAQKRAQLAARLVRRNARWRLEGRTPGGVQLDGPESVDEHAAGRRPRCPVCGNPARWSTVVKAWCHNFMHPDFDDDLPDGHSVGTPEWVPLEYAGEIGEQDKAGQ